MLWEWRGIANMDFIQLGGSSRVGEMILARERSGFAGEKVWDDHQVVPGYSAFGGNTRDLGSFREETDKTTDLHQHLSRISTQKLETASQITHDAITTHLKMASQDLQTTSECLRKPAFVCIAVDMSRKT
ncbi:hypothetical protein Tco_1503164 [Tanacetum coccineum]